MFQKSAMEEDLYKSAGASMGRRTKKLYEDGKAWHNQFLEHVTSKIDEEIFKPLFNAGNGSEPHGAAVQKTDERTVP